MFPAERARLYKIITETGANGVIMLTGDRHSAALYRKEGVNDYPLFEATSSSLNLPLRAWLDPNQPFAQEPGPNRRGDMVIDANYGLIEIDSWALPIRMKPARTSWGRCSAATILGSSKSTGMRAPSRSQSAARMVKPRFRKR